MENEEGILDPDWFGFDWSPWVSLDPDDSDIATVTTEHGVYRVRHDAYDGLIYIGETGRSLRGRLRALASGVFKGEMPYSDPHTGSPSLWAIEDRHGSGFEASVATPPGSDDKQERNAIEDALIAVYRRETGRNLVGNFGRMPPGYEKSKSRSADFRGGLAEDDQRRSFWKGTDPLTWANPEDLTGTRWMGLDWTEPQRLTDASADVPGTPGLYRIWDAENTPPLEYIGQTVNLRSRLYSHRRNRDPELHFSWVEVDNIDKSFKLSQLETDLLGAHWLTCGEAPREQY